MMRLALAVVLALGACGATSPAPAGPTAAKPFKMRAYYLTLLRKGPKWSREFPGAGDLLKGHMNNMRRLGVEGKLLIAGPTEVPDDAPTDKVIGIFIFDVPTLVEAEAAVQTDPTVAAGYFSAEVLEWYGPAGLTFDGREAELARTRAELR